MVANLTENAFKHAAVPGGGRRRGGRLLHRPLGPGRRTRYRRRRPPPVFERHFTSDRATGSRLGSGLGLAIVSELAAAMKAVVTAESPVIKGRGTRMTVWLRPPGTPPPDDRRRDLAVGQTVGNACSSRPGLLSRS